MGNTVFPLLEEIPSLFVYACDFSPRAIEFVKVHSIKRSYAVADNRTDVTLVLDCRFNTTNSYCIAFYWVVGLLSTK